MPLEATRTPCGDSSSTNCSRRWASSTRRSNTTALGYRWERSISGPAPGTGHASACFSSVRGDGGGLWTQRGTPPAARERIAAGMPADSFMAVGSQGQYTIVIPSRDLVIVKIGWAYTPHDGHVAVERLVRETVAALPSKSEGGNPTGSPDTSLR